MDAGREPVTEAGIARDAPDEVDARLEAAIIELLQERAPGATICPSEAARQIGGEDDWRVLMPRARQAARRLTAEGRIDVTQGGEVVDPAEARGPIRLRLRRARPGPGS